LKKLILVPVVCVVILAATHARAQQFDVAFGASTVVAASTILTPTTFTQTQAGGTYLTFRGDGLIRRHFGIGGEVSWRAGRNLYGGFQPFRPLFYDVGAVFAPPLGKYAAADLMAGIGAESIRFYQSQYVCGFTGCTNYTSSNHFMGHLGAGLRLYPKGNFFIEPEAHLYLVHNNVEFSGSHPVRVGISIGYSFRSEY
jgi:hypothetical protein